MEITKGEIEGIFIIEPRIFEDDRGYFFEAFKACDFVKQVCECRFVQENEAKSSYGVVRGLHYQLPPHAQSKLVRVIKGRIIDVAVDIRKSSPTFGKHIAVELSDENHRQIFIPQGFAHGYSVLSEEAIVEYKCDNYYAPESEGAIAWDDATLDIDWGIPTDEIILSEKDKHHPTLAECDKLFD
jgi:dTDP-4-dehydrorhamnose 3,5-epimerase